MSFSTSHLVPPARRAVQASPDRADAGKVMTTAEVPADVFLEQDAADVAVSHRGFSDAPVSDRRRSRRDDQDLPAWLSPAGRRSASAGGQVRVADLSLHGVGMLSPTPMETGGAHWIVVNGGALRLSCRLRVVSCRRRGDGRYECGGEFF